MHRENACTFVFQSRCANLFSCWHYLSPVSLHPYQHLVISGLSFLSLKDEIISTIILICISYITMKLNAFFIYVSVSPFANCFFTSFTHFLKGCFSFPYWSIEDFMYSIYYSSVTYIDGKYLLSVWVVFFVCFCEWYILTCTDF